MKNATVSARVHLVRTAGLVSCLFFALFFASRPVLASLGEEESSIEADAAKAECIARPRPEERYTVYEIRSSSGTLVREYVVPGGKVFAVTWRGPWLPDLRQLLGKYFDVFRRAERTHHARRRPFVIDEPDFVLYSSGRARSFFGEAHVPSLVPAGIRVEALP